GAHSGSHPSFSAGGGEGEQRQAGAKATGVGEWAVEVFNQAQQAVALYSILTLVARQQGDFPA
ncbi:hypothetical protein G6X41_08790, partial [Staphylococcus aureus]|nr:hypothetical protein [Staphylococcus aureus]